MPEDEVQPAKKTKHTKKEPPKLLQGRFYEIVTIEGVKVAAKCKECQLIIKGSTGSTGNFKSHYKNVHPTLVSVLESVVKGVDSPAVSNQPTLIQSFPGVSSEKVIVFKKIF